VICSCGPYLKDTDVGLIMGCMDKGKTKLYSYNSKRANEVLEHDTFTQHCESYLVKLSV